MDRRSFLAALAAAPAALLSGCGRGAAPAAGTLRLAFPTDYKSLDPTQMSDTNTLQVLRLLYQGLLDCDDDMNLVPWLAARMPEVSADKRVYTFEIKRGVRFANGRELTAEDFVYSIERAFDPVTKSTGTGFLRNIRGSEAFQKARAEDAAREGPDRGKRLTEPTRLEGVRVLDYPYTLQFELDQPDLAFPWVLTLPFTYPVPREEVERYGEEFYRHPCGTGPFVLEEWERGLRLRFGHNPYYEGPAGTGLDAVEILIGYDWLTETMMFERGELDLLNVPPADFVRLTRDPRWRPQLRSELMPSTDFLVMNCEMEPFNKPEVRRAVCHAVNRQRTMHVVHDMYLPANGFIPPGVFGHNPDRPGYAYDPDKARRLLAEAGYPDGFAVELWYPTDAAVWAKMVEAIQQDLKAVKIDVSLKEMAIEVFYTAVSRRHNVPFSISGWTADYPDAGDFLGALCDGTKITDDQCNNMAFYDDPEVNGWIHAAAVATDEKERLALYRQAEDRLMRDVPYCVLCHEKSNYMCQPRVKGCTMHPIWWVRYENLSLERVMIARLLKRLLWAALTLLGTSLVVFLIAHAVPADPVAAFAGPHADKETRDAIRRELHLDDPLATQYLRFLGHAVRGDFGKSNVTQEPVLGAILARFPATLALSLGGLLIWLAVSLPLGVLTAKYRDKPIDRVVLVLATVTVSVPTFWLGRLLQFELAYRLGWFPVAGLFSWASLVLPSVTLGVVGAGYYARLVHSNMLEVLNQDYIRAARARGLSEPAVLFKHGLRNAFLPVLTVLGMDVAGLLGGVVFTESVFALPGLGALSLQAVLNLDVPMIMGTVLFAALLVVTANLAVDFVYRLVDPRIKGA